MPNHVHLILKPTDDDGLRRVLASTHRRYAAIIQTRRRRKGPLWQGRYAAVAMDEHHLRAAYRYVALNPVRARLVKQAEEWPWSSARALLGLGEDFLTDLAAARERFADFAEFLASDEDREAIARLRRGESVGRPIGSEAFLTSLEAQTGRRLRVRPRGPKVKMGTVASSLRGEISSPLPISVNEILIPPA